MSELNSDFDEVDSSFSVNSELDFTETISNVSSSPSRSCEGAFNLDYGISTNIIRNLHRRELGFGELKIYPLRSYHLKNVFPQQILSSHVFMGMSRCGRFLITYTMLTDQDDEEWYATIYKYRLHWWTFKPAGQARKIAEVSLFGNHKIVAPLQMYICQWPKDHERILVYGLIKENFNADGGALSSHQHAYVTVTALPSLDSCQDCRVVASSYLLDDIAASWDTCLRFSCLKHGYTVHTSFDIVVPYPEFVPKISLKCQDYAVFNTNNFLYAIKISLENCDQKAKEDVGGDSILVDSTEVLLGKSETFLEQCASSNSELTEHQKKVLDLKEQIIRDFSEEIHLTSFCRDVSDNTEHTELKLSCEDRDDKSDPSNNSGNDHCSNTPQTIDVVEQVLSLDSGQLSPPAPTRIVMDSENQNIGQHTTKTEKCDDESKKVDCFLSPQDVKVFTKPSMKLTDCRKWERLVKVDGRSVRSCDDHASSSQRKFKSFFSRHKLQRNSGLFLRKKLFGTSRSLFKHQKLIENSDDGKIESGSLSTCNNLSKYFSRRFNEQKIADTTYEFVDDSHSEVEKISLFRKKRLADKKYEFQDLDSENIVPFSIVRLENTLRSPRKSVDSNDITKTEEDESSEFRAEKMRSPSPRFQERYNSDLSVSVASPRSPLYLDVLTSPNQFVDSVLRPLNRNTYGSNSLSPITKYLSSPPISQRLRSPNFVKQKICDDSLSKTCVDVCKSECNGANKFQCLGTRFILEKGIIINDISERYINSMDKIQLDETEIYLNLFKNMNKFHGNSIRFERRFIEVDDELVSVLTDIDDDDMSAITGYHTALNVEIHGAGYVQLQMISNLKAEKLMAQCVVFDQQTLDIEAICHSVATTLCNVSNKTYTFCNDYDVEVLDVCPRSSEVLVLLLMRIEGCDGIKDEVSKIEHYEASVTFVWSLTSNEYHVCMVVPPKQVDWVWNEKDVWNPAKEASRRFRLQLPADVTLCEPAVRVLTNASTFRGISLDRIEDFENGVRFVL